VSDDEARRQLRCRDGGPGRRRELLAYLGFDPAGGDAGDRLWFVSQGWAHASRGGRADERGFLATPGLAPSTLPEPVAADVPPPAAAPAEVGAATKHALAAIRRDAEEAAGDAAARRAARDAGAATLEELRPSARYTGLRRLEGPAKAWRPDGDRPRAPRPATTRALDASLGDAARLEVDVGGEAALLRGPSVRLADYLALCAHVRSLGGAPPSDRVAPVFVFSRGRAESPYVDQDRPLALGGHAPGRLRHVWVVVVDPGELEAYASRHPDALFLALPRAGRAVGYARSVAQRVCSVGATACGFYWSVDDNVVRFQKWVATRRGGRAEERPSADFSKYLEALLYAQNLPDASEYAEIGFLRQRGTAVCVRQAHATNVLSVYKCLLLNNGLLRSRSVAYNPVLSRFEDIALSHAAVAAGLKTLKCYGYSYTAANLQRGGCAGLRFHLRGDHGLARDDVAEPLARTGPVAPDVEREVRTIVDWVQSWVDRESSDVAGGELVEAGRDAVELGDSAFALADWAPARRCGGVDLANTTFRSELLPHQWRALEFLRAAETDAAFRSRRRAVCKSNLQPDFNVRVFECVDTSTSAVLRELAESNRFVQKISRIDFDLTDLENSEAWPRRPSSLVDLHAGAAAPSSATSRAWARPS